MKFATVLLAALLLPAAAYAAVEVTEEEILANPGWGRRQLAAKKPSKKPSKKPTKKPTKKPSMKPSPSSAPVADDKTLPLSFTTLTRSGASARPGDAPMGGLLGTDGSPVFTQVKRGGTFGPVADPADTPGDGNNGTVSSFYTIAGQQEISTNPDYTSILPVGEKLYAFTHFEGPLPSQLYFMELQQNAATGAMHVRRQKPVDWSKWGGLWLPCAGSVTPWGTHLGSEEYEPDARPIQAATSLDGDEATSLAKLSAEQYGNMVSFMRYFGVYYDNLTIAKVQNTLNPYHYGYVTELKAGPGFSYTNVKHYVMGRISHEMGDVMPDEKTVYMTDDGTNTGLYKFVADKKADLSRGTLYMAKVRQNTPAGETGPAATTSFDITWIRLGHANQEQIEDIINVRQTTFTDIFDTAKPAADAPFCPSGFTSINAGQSDANHECLRVKPNMRVEAAFLETRRYGAILGGTTEFSKLEGMVLNMKRRTLAFAASDVRYGMENNQKQGKANTKYDVGGSNDIRLTYNPCGCVYEISLLANYDSKKIKPLVCGNPNPTVAVTDNSCDVNGIASPDNLALIPEQNILIIGEDTSAHQNDMVWAYDYSSRALTRIATSPYGSEYTSVDWYELGNWGYLTAVVQHPYGESDELRLLDGESTGRAGTIGYIGPVKLSDIKGKKLAFTELSYARTNSEKHNIRVSPSLRSD